MTDAYGILASARFIANSKGISLEEAVTEILPAFADSDSDHQHLKEEVKRLLGEQSRIRSYKKGRGEPPLGRPQYPPPPGAPPPVVTEKLKPRKPLTLENIRRKEPKQKPHRKARAPQRELSLFDEKG